MTDPGQDRRAAVLAGARIVLAALAGAVAVGVGVRLGGADARGEYVFWAILGAAALAGSLAAALGVRRGFERRLRALAALLDARREGDLLARLPDLGGDEVGRIAAAFNRLLARLTRLQGEAIDRDRELESTQRALELAEALAEKSAELEQRLRERAVLFEVVRESADGHDLGRVLGVLAERTAEALRLRQVAVALRDGEGRLVVRAAWGFEDPDDVLDRAVARPSLGPFAPDAGIVVVPDVSRAPVAMRLVDALADDGSLARVPIVHRGEDIGLFLATRPPDDPLGETEGHFLEAVADQAGLAIQNAQLIERLETAATHDELTGLPNRRLFARRLERALARADRHGHPVSVLALDLDHFKQLNDRAGHAAGDAALIEVAEVLRGSLRAVDTPARVGGEELLVLLGETDAEGAREVAEKLRAGIAALDVEGAAAQPLGHLSVSVGLATRRLGEGGASLLERADAALYEAKRGGRDRVSVAP